METTGGGGAIDWRAAFDAFMENDAAAAMGRVSRETAFERFEAHGVPNRRHEYWRYTPVRDLSPGTSVAARAGASDPFAAMDAYRLVFVDGRLDAERSDRAALAAAVDVADASGAPWMNQVFHQLQGQPNPGAKFQVERPMADLNLALFTDGLAVRIPSGVTLEKADSPALRGQNRRPSALGDVGGGGRERRGVGVRPWRAHHRR